MKKNDFFCDLHGLGRHWVIRPRINSFTHLKGSMDIISWPTSDSIRKDILKMLGPWPVILEFWDPWLGTRFFSWRVRCKKRFISRASHFRINGPLKRCRFQPFCCQYIGPTFSDRKTETIDRFFGRNYP